MLRLTVSKLVSFLTFDSAFSFGRAVTHICSLAVPLVIHRIIRLNLIPTSNGSSTNISKVYSINRTDYKRFIAHVNAPAAVTAWSRWLGGWLLRTLVMQWMCANRTWCHWLPKLLSWKKQGGRRMAAGRAWWKFIPKVRFYCKTWYTQKHVYGQTKMDFGALCRWHTRFEQ